MTLLANVQARRKVKEGVCASRFMHLRASGMHIHRLKIRNLISWDTVEKIHQHFPAKWMPACAFLCPCPHNINMHARFDQTAAVLRVQFAVGSMMLDLAHTLLTAMQCMLPPCSAI